jgi:uncharacterized protein
MTDSPRRHRVAISGASGFLGTSLANSLREDGVDLVRLVRHRPERSEVYWDPELGRIDEAGLEGLDAVVHLAGESIAGYWSAGKKRRIMESRSRGTRLLATTLAQLKQPPGTFVSASGVGYYGDAGEQVLDESSPPGDDFIARVCVAWEDGTRPAAEAGVRVVRTRFGLVLDRRGGALSMMLPPFRLGLGAQLGSGRQWMSWIALQDALRVLRLALDTDTLSGAVNACSPQPVRNAEFTRALARSLRRPAFLRVPSFALRLATGGMADQVLLASQRAVPSVLAREGFHFSCPGIDQALAAKPFEGR